MKKLKTLTKILLIAMIPISMEFYMATDAPAQLPPAEGKMKASTDSNGQVSLTENGKPILRYNYQMVYETDEYAFNGLDANEYVVTENDTFMANPSIYAVERSNYIHPLFGLNGEILTRDWSKDHPHPVSYTHLTLPTTPYV